MVYTPEAWEKSEHGSNPGPIGFIPFSTFAPSPRTPLPQEAPEVETGALVNAGLNGFAVQALTESIRRFKDFETCGDFAFRYRGVRFSLRFDPESDKNHSDRREAAGVPRDDYHWAEKERRGEIAAAPKVEQRTPTRTDEQIAAFVSCEQGVIADNFEPEDFKCLDCRSNMVRGVMQATLEFFTSPEAPESETR